MNTQKQTKLRKTSYFLTILLLAFLFANGCSQLDIVQNETDPRTVIVGDNVNDRALSYRTGDDKPTFRELVLGGDGEFDSSIDSLTFNVVLDKLSFMPLASVDSASGVVITDWYAVNANKLRIKINVRIIDNQLTDDSIVVQIFKQEFDGNKWNDLGLDNDQADKIKTSILSEARSLKSAIDLS